MASLDQLKEVLKESLEARGVLNEVKSRIRAEIYHALDDETIKRPQLSNANLMINELIREYFEFNRYQHSLSVFLPESHQPRDSPFTREFLLHQLHVDTQRHNDKQQQFPLLYHIVDMLHTSTPILETVDYDNDKRTCDSEIDQRHEQQHEKCVSSELNGVSELRQAPDDIVRNELGLAPRDPIAMDTFDILKIASTHDN